MRAGTRFAWLGWWLLVAPSALAAEPDPVLAPLTTEGYLWAGPLPVLPTTGLQLELGYLYQTFDVDWSGVRDPEMHSFVLSLRGEMTFLGRLTAGFELPALVTYDAEASARILGVEVGWDDSGADFGNLRLHLRWLFVAERELGLFFTAALRVWLPTNTFLEVEADETHELELVDGVTQLEPSLLLGWGNRRFSALLATGPKFFVLLDDDQVAWEDDFSCWGLDLVLGSAPVPALDELELLLELNLLFELDEDDAPSEEADDRVQALALGLGFRYRIGAWRLGLGLRVGLHEHAFYMGQLGLGVTLDYLWEVAPP